MSRFKTRRAKLGRGLARLPFACEPGRASRTTSGYTRANLWVVVCGLLGVGIDSAPGEEGRRRLQRRSLARCMQHKRARTPDRAG